MSILSAICHFVRIILFIACTPSAGSSTEHMFTVKAKVEDSNSQGWVVQHIDRGGIARAESVCEDSQTDHV